MKGAFRISPARELHTGKSWLRDVILGGQDGLVNVLGIVLGVSAANGSTHILVAASLAAAFAESISMAAVAYTSALAEKDHYQKELERETKEIETVPAKEKAEIEEIYRKKGFSGKMLSEVVAVLIRDKQVWLKTMMEEELSLEPVDIKSILQSSIVVGLAALGASFVPLLPFLFTSRLFAVPVSLVASGLVLFVIGAYEAKSYVGSWWKSGLKMLIIGFGAAAAGFFVGKIFQVN